MLADAEITGPNAIRLDTDNVLAVTLSPAGPFIDSTRPLRIYWNGAAARSVALQDGRVKLLAAGYAPAPLHKTGSIAGPIGSVMDTPFAVILGTIAQDEMTRQFCNRKAQEIADYWKNWQHQPVRLYKDVDVPEAELSKYSLILIGGSEANAVTRKLADSLPLKVSAGEISLDGHVFKAPDAAVEMVYPNPLNRERYVLVAAASSPAGMYFANVWGMSDFDFVITDGAVANTRHGRPEERVRIAAGLFDNNWRIANSLLDQGDPEIRARSPCGKCNRI
jgi:hypothetical protein